MEFKDLSGFTKGFNWKEDPIEQGGDEILPQKLCGWIMKKNMT